jgi:dolichol-phosphate mannosyltransferase
MKSRLSVIVTAYNEGEKIAAYLTSLLEALTVPAEVLVVYDFAEDTSAPYASEVAARDQRVKPLLNTYGRGPAWAIRYGFDHARGDIVVVTMADGCDDVTQIEDLARLVEGGAAIAAASRYMRGGRKIGGPFLKGALSRIAGLSLYHLAGVGTRDATNSFKAYDAAFVREAGISSTGGFEIGIELVAKARRLRRRVTEIPTTWHERNYGESNFKLGKWLPKYLRWYLYAFGRRGRAQQVRAFARPVTSARAEDA